MISERALNDDKAVSLVEALAVANEAAHAAGVYLRPIRLMIEERTAEDGTSLWQINFLPNPPPGVFLRGGDYRVEVNAENGLIYRVLSGQ